MDCGILEFLIFAVWEIWEVCLGGFGGFGGFGELSLGEFEVRRCGDATTL